MKKVLFLSLALVSVLFDSSAFAAAARRGRATSGTTGTAATASAPKTTAARAATNSRTAPRTGATSGTAGRTTAARSATPTTAKAPTVAARAATTQKVVGTGTKVAGAAKNIVVNEECQAKYEGCMDSFCMLDNESGGRCICSDKNAELDAIFAEIEKLDEQSYQMATLGVEKLEMGADADAAIAAASSVVNSIKNGDTADGKKKARKALDLSMWDATADFAEEEDIFAVASDPNSLDGKEGDALHVAAAALCKAQIPECANDINMLQMMYGQRIKSDCAAYENVLKQKKTQSAQKLQAAERALRETALEQYQNANKYDLGQCTIKFKECMQTTAGCGSDFSNCASVSAFDSTNTRRSTSKKTKNYQIAGAVSNIEISASTYDALMAKKPLCETVTKQCAKVASQVWDTFLKEVAPQLKSAEIIAEDNARQDCIGNISSCFQKACKDTIDPKDPDGSYDMCLSRPEAMLNLCKVPLNACGIDASSASAAQKSDIWDFVTARLAAMRVDSCTTEVKECLQAEDRCGKDYSNCIGLDTDAIIRMCPYDKLVGCQKVYGEEEIRGDAVYEELARIAQGIMLNIDNEMIAQCQKAVDNAMIKVCGDTQSCTSLTVDENIGARSLEYKICEYTADENGMLDINYNLCRTDVSQIQDSELGRYSSAPITVDNPDTANDEVLDSVYANKGGEITPFAGVLDGTIYWESVNFDSETGKLTTSDEYLSKAEYQNMTQKQKDRVASELNVLQRNIDMAIQSIESDPTVQYCMSGRTVPGVQIKEEVQKIGRGKDAARYPELTKQMRMIIANQALKIAKDNYYKKYDELNNKILSDYAKIGERIAEIQGKNSEDARRELARIACVEFAESASLPKSAEPPKNAFGKIVSMVAIAGAAIGIPFTGGLSGAALLAATIAPAAGAVAISGIGLLGNAGSKSANGDDVINQTQLTGSKALNNWNYKETITSTFTWDTLQCQKCVRTQTCKTTKNPVFGNKYCKDWNDAVETCTETQF